MDKNKAVVDFLMTCPYMAENPLFFNFGKSVADNKQVVFTATDVNTHKPFIDGSIQKRFTFTIIDYKSVSYKAVIADRSDENMEDVVDVQSILDWINTQNDLRNYPDFGESCTIDSMTALTDQPNLNGVDKSSTVPLAKYSISIKIEYIDYSKSIWDKKGA